MLDTTRLPLFLSAALLLAIAPGPGMLYVLARSLAGGRREGILSALGTLVGGMTHVLAAAAGVSLILARSAVAFATVKYAGAAYLGFLGVRMIVDARHDADSMAISPSTSARNPFWQGIATEVLNPKTALFSLFHSAVCRPRIGPRLLAVRNPGVDLGGLEYVRGFTGYRLRRTTWRAHSLIDEISPRSADHDRRRDARPRHLPRVQ